MMHGAWEQGWSLSCGVSIQMVLLVVNAREIGEGGRASNLNSQFATRTRLSVPSIWNLMKRMMRLDWELLLPLSSSFHYWPGPILFS